MTKNNSDLRNFLNGALGYLAGAAGGVLFIFIAAQIGLLKWLVGLVDENQYLVKLFSVPIFAGLMLAMAGAIIGGVGGWSLGTILGVARKRRQVIGSAVAFAITVSAFIFVFLLLFGFIGIYNNFTANKVEHYGLVFGLVGLIFGLFTGIIQSLLSLRLRDTWRLILAATIGFALGGALMGLLVRLVNPTAGFQTYPILTWFVLFLALTLPFILGGGALGFTYGRLAKRITGQAKEIEIVQPSAWQTGIVALIGFMLVFRLFSMVDQITEFLTIYQGNTNTQLTSETIGVHWTEPKPYTENIEAIKQAEDGQTTVRVEGADQSVHQAWCSGEGVITYQYADDAVEQIDFPECQGIPALALDADGLPHLVWYTTEIRDTNGTTRTDSLLVDSIRLDSGWSEPAIVTRTKTEAVPVMASDPAGNLLLVWWEVDQEVFYAVQEKYACDEKQLSNLELAGLQALVNNGTRPDGTEIPYCRNQYNQILYTPNPEPTFSTDLPTPNSAFDKVSAGVVGRAQYEVLFATMQYEPSRTPPSPGNVLAEGVAKLYRDVKTHPENYPRGMTVRILLGNYPVMSTLDWGAQINDAISDFRAAGVEKMVDPEIGWRLEFANFPGVYPHSHTKFVVIDGKRVTAVGFNYGYLHLPKDHPSGEGYDLLDLGLVIEGPIAQETVSVYDDMWSGADQVYCDYYPTDGSDWQDTCVEKKAVADHMPEVLRYYLPPDGNDNVFSLYRNSVFKEADNFIATGLMSSTKTIDMMEVNFSLEVQCMLNIIFPDFCTIDNALPWMNALLEDIKKNDTHVRVIMENSNSNGLENRVAAYILMDELTRLGLEDNVELRFYNGKVHAKSMLLDSELLVIGSQNMHYSSWGDSGLNEYSLATDDPQAIEEYQTFYNVKWEQSAPFDEVKYGTSP